MSGACEVSGMLFLSGQIHADSEWNLQGETIEEKFTVTMSNIEKILFEANLTVGDIAHVRLYLTDLKELSELNEVYIDYFEHPLPARTAIEVKALPLGATLEIDVIAGK